MASNDLFDLFTTPTTEKQAPQTTTTTTTNKTTKTITKEEIVKTLKEYDGSGLGLLTKKQCLAAMRDLSQLGMTEKECEDFVQMASEICSDASGKIKLEDLATQLAFEVRKKTRR